MNKKRNYRKTTTAPSTPTVVRHELNIRSADRGRKDMTAWKHALLSAESVTAPNRVRLYDLYEDVILDGHLSGVIAKRMDAVLNKELYYEKDGKRLYAFEPLIHSLSFRNIVRTILETQLWGISGMEFIPGGTLAYEHIPRKHIKPEHGVISFEQSSHEGIPYAPMDNVWVIGEPHDLGLLLKCAPYSLYKRGGIADWAEYVEIFGQPVRVVKYDTYDEQTKAELQRSLEESGSSLTMMIPKQADFEIKDGKHSNSDGSLQLSFIKALNDEMSILMLGNTETTSSSYSSGYAQSKIHLQQQYEITKSDIAYATAMLNHPKFIKILASYGYPVEGGSFVFSKDMDADYLTKRINIDKEVAQMVQIPADYWFDTYGIRQPEQL